MGRRSSCFLPAAAVAAVGLVTTSVLSSVLRVFGNGGAAFAGAAAVRGRGALVSRHAEEAMSIGHVLQEDKTWALTTEGVPIQGEQDESEAESCWQAFQKQFKVASEKGMYLDTPVAEQDVKYRFRRLRDTFGVSGSEALEMMQTDALPLVIDSNYVKKTFDAMVEGGSKEQALTIVKRHPGILAAGETVKDNMMQADMVSQFISVSRDIGKAFR